MEYAQISSTDTVVDAYCGIGTISLFLAQQAKQVYGVEVVPEAVNDAKQNAKLNGITNAAFYVGEAEKIMPWWTAQGMRPDVIVVDPPRKGCDEQLLTAMANMKPERIVYVSCNRPHSLGICEYSKTAAMKSRKYSQWTCFRRRCTWNVCRNLF